MLERKITKKIGHMEAGQTAFSLITKRFKYHSDETWAQYFQDGRIHINDISANIATIINCGDIMTYYPPEIQEPEVNKDYTILYEDEDLIFINKPAGLPCHPSGKFFRHTLWALLKEERPTQEIHIIHRLDRETTGIVLITKNKTAAHKCQQQFVNHSIEKKYLTIVEGVLQDELQATGWITNDPTSKIRKKQKFYLEKPEARPDSSAKIITAITYFKPIKTNNGLTLIEATPQTGRLHQIRASIFSLGFPVVGDKLYGVDEELFIKFINDELTKQDYEKLRIYHQALHAWKLTINHPTTNKQLIITSPPPSSFDHLMNS